MNKESIEQRIAALEKEVFNGFDTVRQRNALAHVATFLRDLALEVSELHPEELTMEDMREYSATSSAEEVERMLERVAKDERNDERDKLAEQLVSSILNNQGMYPPNVLTVATQLKVNLDASKK